MRSLSWCVAASHLGRLAGHYLLSALFVGRFIYLA